MIEQTRLIAIAVLLLHFITTVIGPLMSGTYQRNIGQAIKEYTSNRSFFLACKNQN
ncbi:MAG: hypothetical protein IPP79_14460 [Chitinophagaceae bacterium]|nr:hypothetical protein [Chitinophagaceae bacterium]